MLHSRKIKGLIDQVNRVTIEIGTPIMRIIFCGPVLGTVNNDAFQQHRATIANQAKISRKISPFFPLVPRHITDHFLHLHSMTRCFAMQKLRDGVEAIRVSPHPCTR